MTWRGFTKAMSRMPQVVMQKAGYADETFDEDFERISGEFDDLERSCKKLAEESRLFQVSIRDLMAAQKHIGETFIQLHSITKSRDEIAEGGAQVGIGPLGDCLGVYINSTAQWHDAVQPYIEQTLSGIVVDPASAFVVITKQVRLMIEKRGRKLIDYDRERNNVRKIKDKLETGGSSDPSKLSKAESAFQEVRREYEGLNERLKYEIPILLKMRSEFMDPYMEALISFQIYFFEQGMSSLQPLGDYLDFSLAIKETYDQKKMEGIELLKSLSIVIPQKIDPNADPSERNYQDLPPYSESGLSSESSQSGTSSDFVCMAVSIYPYESSTPGDLYFAQDEKIQVVQKTDNQEDWWVGRIGDRQGYFPANYVRLLQ